MDRRAFVADMARASVALAARPAGLRRGAAARADAGPVTLLLCGDVMTGRGIDQILPHPSDPRLFEPYVRSAREYVELAEAKNGPIPKPVAFTYPWGDVIEWLSRAAPGAVIVNLETAVTTSDDHAPSKGIHYRMHPRNVPCLTAAGIDCCTLANNHVLDWGRAGLDEALATLRRAGIATAGAGRDLEAAAAPATLAVGPQGRVLVFAFGVADSGIADGWGAAEGRPGVHLLRDLTARTARDVGERVRRARRAGDVVVASIHWGGNWGYAVSREQREFAHALIEAAGVDVVFGHSSHHAKGIEVYRDRPILYGCGDFLNDYEGIGGYEEFRGDLALAYLVSVDPADGTLAGLVVSAFTMRRFRLAYASPGDTAWVRNTLTREGRPFGTSLESGPEPHTLMLRWGRWERGGDGGKEERNRRS